MAVTFENKDVIITEEHIQHIMDRHVNVPKYTKNTPVFPDPQDLERGRVV